MNKTQIVHEALLLEPEDRAELAQSLLLSLEEITEDQLREKWMRVAAERAAELDRGDVKSIPYEQVVAEAAALLR